MIDRAVVGVEPGWPDILVVEPPEDLPWVEGACCWTAPSQRADVELQRVQPSEEVPPVGSRGDHGAGLEEEKPWVPREVDQRAGAPGGRSGVGAL